MIYWEMNTKILNIAVATHQCGKAFSPDATVGIYASLRFVKHPMRIASEVSNPHSCQMCAQTMPEIDYSESNCVTCRP